jgi:hypothetical protein
MAGKSNKKLKLADFPSISSILESDELTPLIEKWSFPFVSGEVKTVAAGMKKLAVKKNTIPGKNEIVSQVFNVFNQYDNDLICIPISEELP